MQLNKPRSIFNNEKICLFFTLNIIFQFFLIHKFESSVVFLIPWILFIFVFKLTIAQVAITTLSSMALVLFVYLASSKDTNLVLYLNKLCNLNKLLTNFVNRKYEPKLASFINLLVFNFQKSKSEAYKEFADFGISYILVIGGFHLDFLKKLFTWPLKKINQFINIDENKWNKNIERFVFVIIFIYWWSTNFIIAGFRIICNMLFKSENKIIGWCKSVIITFLIFPYSVIGYSFLLSFFIPLIFYLIEERDNNGSIKNIYRHFGAFIFSHILLLPFSKKLYFLSFINYIIFYPVIMFLFVYFLLFFICVFLEPLHMFLHDNFKIMMEILPLNKNYLYLPQFNTFHSSIIVCCMIVLYLLFVNQKNKHKEKQIQFLLTNF